MPGTAPIRRNPPIPQDDTSPSAGTAGKPAQSPAPQDPSPAIRAPRMPCQSPNRIEHRLTSRHHARAARQQRSFRDGRRHPLTPREPRRTAGATTRCRRMRQLSAGPPPFSRPVRGPAALFPVQFSRSTTRCAGTGRSHRMARCRRRRCHRSDLRPTILAERRSWRLRRLRMSLVVLGSVVVHRRRASRPQLPNQPQALPTGRSAPTRSLRTPTVSAVAPPAARHQPRTGRRKPMEVQPRHCRRRSPEPEAWRRGVSR